MRVQRLEISNFMRVRSVTIVPVGNLVRLHGNNRQGKTAILRALQAAFGGKKFHPKRPIHDGAEEATILVDVGDFTIEVVFRAENKVDLTVRTADGAKVRSPQATLDGFVGAISFDALAFMRLSPQEQVELLRKLAGVDFTALDQERSALYSKRTDVGRDRDKAVAQGNGATGGELKEVSLADLTAQLQAVSDAETEHRLQESRISALDQEGVRLSRQIDDAQKSLRSLQESLTNANTKLRAARAVGGETEKILRSIGDGAAIREKLRTAEADNARARDLTAKRAKKLEGDALHKQYDAITKEIDGLDAKKRKMVAAAKLPVEGLDFTGAEVTFGGRPLSQASDREQVLISAAIGHSLNPKLAALLIREGAFLDEDGWKALSAWADERDVQVWIEDVGVDGAGILIEDGMVVEGDPVAEFPRKGEPLAEARGGSVGSNGRTPPESVAETNEAEAAMLDNDEDDEATDG